LRRLPRLLPGPATALLLGRLLGLLLLLRLLGLRLLFPRLFRWLAGPAARAGLAILLLGGMGQLELAGLQRPRGSFLRGRWGIQRPSPGLAPSGGGDERTFALALAIRSEQWSFALAARRTTNLHGGVVHIQQQAHIK
jgi:hypothetical protein